MSRVALDEPILSATSPAASLAVGREVRVLKRGTEEEAEVYSAESGGVLLSQPLRTGDSDTGIPGLPLGEGDTIGWVEEGSYTLLVLPRRTGEKAQTLYWEAAKGGGGTVDLSGYQATTEKGAAGGYASLEAAGKVPAAQLPSAVMEYQGTWNAATNTPKLEDGKGSAGDVYRVSVAGERNLGSGSISFEVGDYAVYNGSTWEKSDTTDAVASVAGKKGAVTLVPADVDGLVAALEAKQPSDSDLAAIAALSTTEYGRSLLTQASAAKAREALGLGTAATQASGVFDAAGAAAAAQAASQPVDADLTAIAGLSPEDGAILLRSGGSWAALAKGNAGDQLIVRADGTTLTWVKPSAVKAAAWGVKADGVTDDSAALESAIAAAIAAKLPLEMPGGDAKTTKEIAAVTDYFCMYGAGTRKSRIVPEKSTYHGFRVGPGAEGSGNRPGGYIRDVEIAGGNAAITTAGAGPTSGKAALMLDGIRLFDLERVSVTGAHDIAFDFTHNCFGVTMNLCRVDLNSCRVAVNFRKGEENGEDMLLTNCWLAGEVAAIHVASSGKNYRVIGGQLSAARQNTIEEDNRGVVILCKDYLTGETVAGGEVHMQLQTSFEFFPKVWAIRSFGRVHLDLRSSFNPNGAGGPGIGFFKGSSLVESVVEMHNCNIHGKWIKYGASMVVLEGTNGDFQWLERGSWGIYENTSGSESTHAEWNPIWLLAKITNSGGSNRSENIVHMGGGVLQKREGEAIKWSRDWGATWAYLTPEGKTYASANTITLDRGIALAKITGTTAIKKINPTYEGHVVVLKFAEALTLTVGENLKIGASFAATADDAIALICDGTNWYRIAAGAAN